MSRQPTKEDIPRRLYSCQNEGCAEEVSYWAEDLWWHDGSGEAEAGFYCDPCWGNDYALMDMERCVSLKEVVDS